MKREVELSILKELLRQIDEKQNVDAGVMYRNTTDVYTCPDIAKQERQLFFRDHPQLIALSGSLPKPGSYMTVDDFGVPVLATRDAEGRFRAFVNACRHRGTRVAEGSGEASKFMCPFHNWTYANSGKLIGIPMVSHFGQIDKSCNGLIELPAVEQYGLLWVHPRADSQIDVDELLGDLAPEIADLDCGAFSRTGETVFEKRINWKLINDTFGETYHVARLHKNSAPNAGLYSDVLGFEEFGRNNRFVAATRGIDALRNKSEDEWKLLDGAIWEYFVFPNTQLLVQPDSLNIIKMYPDPDQPDNPSRSVTRITHYFSQAMIDQANADDGRLRLTAENLNEHFGDPEAVMTPSAIVALFATVLENEDFVMGEMQQRAAESGQVESLLFGRNEAPLHHYHTHFREALGLAPLERIEP